MLGPCQHDGEREGRGGVSEDAGVEVDLDNPGDRAEEEHDEAEYHEVVEQPRVVLAAPVLCLLLPVDSNDEVERADDDNQDPEDANPESDAAPERLNIGLCL